MKALTPLAAALLLSACGGGGDARSGSCDAVAEKRFVLDVAREWYLFPEDLPASIDPAAFADAESLLDALTARSREQGKDRFFSFLTTRSADNANSAGELTRFGFQFEPESDRLRLSLVLQPGPAFQAGLQRGDQILAVDQRDGRGFRTIEQLRAEDPTLAGVFGPNTGGVQRGLRIQPRDPVQAVYELSLTKTSFIVDPVPDEGGLRLIPRNGQSPVGYLQFLDFSTAAEADLRAAFNTFRAQGVTDYLIDLRYNGGGLLSVAYLFGDLLGRERRTTEVFAGVSYNPSKSSRNETRFFRPQPQSVAPLRIAFLTGEGTASASELMVNSLLPYAEVAIIGADTFGKPVGQSAFDQPGCDTRLRLVTLKLVNAEGLGEYYNGLADVVPVACGASDDLSRETGDPAEAVTRAGLDWLADGRCPAMSRSAGSRDSLRGERFEQVQ